MRIDKGAGNRAPEFFERSANSVGLPKMVCFLGRESSHQSARSPSFGVYEFEVVTGNASYREGERFYLTPAQAERAYFAGRRTS